MEAAHHLRNDRIRKVRAIHTDELRHKDMELLQTTEDLHKTIKEAKMPIIHLRKAYQAIRAWAGVWVEVEWDPALECRRESQLHQGQARHGI